MSEKLKAILENEIDDAIGYLETETTDERQQALEYYLREPYGNEVEGKSSIVTGEVAEVVDGALPQLMRLFASGDKVVSFEPVNDGDQPFAKQATEYVNWVFNKDNDGFLVMHNWFKDALLQKVGVGVGLRLDAPVRVGLRAYVSVCGCARARAWRW